MKESPSRTKWRFPHIGNVREGKLAKGNNKLTWGSYGLKSLECKLVDYACIESARKVLSRNTKKIGSLRINVFTDVPRTKKGLVRQGCGKGSVEKWSARVFIGTILFELKDVPEKIALESLRKCSYKLNIPCQVVSLDKDCR